MTRGSAITSQSASEERPAAAKFRAAAALAACFAIVAARPASAADSAQKAACLRSSEAGQRLRAAGRLREARVSFLVCAKDQCPAVVRDDCAQWTGEVTEAMPSVVFAAREGGHPVTNVSVEVDGEVLATRLEGAPLLLDPGEHHLRFAHQGSRSAEQTVTLTKGEKKRLLTIELEAPSAGSGEPESPRPAPVLVTTPSTTFLPSTPPPGPQGAARYVGPLAFGGAGVVAVGIGTYLLVHAASDVSTLEGSCSPYCGHDAVDRLRARALAGDVILGIGATSLLAAGYLYFFTQPRSAGSPRSSSGSIPGARRFDFDVAPGVHGGEALLRGSF
jgi:hypothetical protein